MSYSKAAVDEIFLEFSRDLPRLLPPPTKSQLAMVHHVLDRVFTPGCRIVDLGGGLNPRNGVFARLGGSVTVIDIFEYDLAWSVGKGPEQFAADCEEIKQYLTSAGVRFVDSDICKVDLRSIFAAESVDAVTSYHCLEHLHQSPKAVLESALRVLKPGGRLLVEVPNAVNLLKRFKVLAGRTNYGSYEDFYDAANFTGHVREYAVCDLHALARRLGLSSYAIYGRNWYGTLFDKLGDNAISGMIDRSLQRFPGLCGSLFLDFRKSS
jgi:SAM-dependent methyltransferase